MKRILAGVVLSALMFASGASAAVTYAFSSVQTVDIPIDENDPGLGFNSVVVNRSFTLTVANFINDGQFAPDTCSIDQPFNTCNTTMTFDADPIVDPFLIGNNGDYIGFNNLFDNGIFTGSGTAFYFFTPGAFSAVGVYSTAGFDPGGGAGSAGLGTLTVSGSPTGAIPEPTTWALMILGFGSAGAMLRRRRLHTLAGA